MKETWQFIQDKLKDNIKVILLVVIDNDGSSPGQPGFKMAIAGDGTMTGSIGGGNSEFRLVEKAKRYLLLDNPEISLKREVHRKEAGEDNSGMICSGEQWVAFYPIESIDQNTIKNILISINKGESGMVHFTQEGFVFKIGDVSRHKHQNSDTSIDKWIYSEVIGKTNQLYIFGAGHVGLALSDIASKLGFEVHIFDDRKDVNTMDVNTFAHFKQVIDYKKANEYVPEGEHIYIVIMTFGHKSDEVVLRQFIDRKIKYLGMMGSSRKVESVFRSLKKDGFDKEQLKKVYAPIGVEISSQTPYEISVSIVAEMIRIKNNLHTIFPES